MLAIAPSVTNTPQGVDTQAFCYDAQNRLTWAGSTGTPACGSSLTPGDTGSLSGAGARYSASYSYDTRNRLTAAPLGAYSYGVSARVDAATTGVRVGPSATMGRLLSALRLLPWSKARLVGGSRCAIGGIWASIRLFAAYLWPV